MRPITTTVTDVGVSAPIPLDLYLKPFQVTIQCVKSGTPTYSVQYTNDDVFSASYNPATGEWNDLSAISGISVDAVDTLISPVTAIRLNITAVVDPTDSVVMRTTQAGVLG